MESVEYCQRHAHVCDDGPGPQSVEVELDGMRLRAGLFQRVDGPHGEVRHQQERHEFAPRLPADLLRSDAGAPRRIQYEHGLTRGLQKRG